MLKLFHTLFIGLARVFLILLMLAAVIAVPFLFCGLLIGIANLTYWIYNLPLGGPVLVSLGVVGLLAAIYFEGKRADGKIIWW